MGRTNVQSAQGFVRRADKADKGIVVEGQTRREAGTQSQGPLCEIAQLPTSASHLEDEEVQHAQVSRLPRMRRYLRDHRRRRRSRRWRQVLGDGVTMFKFKVYRVLMLLAAIVAVVVASGAGHKF